MRPIQQRFERKRGDTEEIVIKIKQDKEYKNITDHSFKLTVAKFISSHNKADGRLFQIIARIIDPINGVIAFDFSEENADFVGQFYFDIEMIKPDGKIRTIVEGNFIITQDIT